MTSALGCLAAPLSFESVRSAPGLLERTDWDEINRTFSEMEEWGRDMLANSGVSADDVQMTRTGDMRLVGQIHEINVPVPGETLSGDDIERIESDFHSIYQQLYARRNLSLPIEVQNWRLLVSGPQPDLSLREQEFGMGEARTETQSRGPGERTSQLRTVMWNVPFTIATT